MPRRGGNRLFLRERQRQDAVIVFRLDVLRIDFRNVKLSRIKTVGTLAADIFVFLIRVLVLGMALGANRQNIAVDIKTDILLFKSRQVGFQHIFLAVIGDIRLEFGKRSRIKESKRIGKEIPFKSFHIAERIIRRYIVFAFIGFEIKHNNYLRILLKFVIILS